MTIVSWDKLWIYLNLLVGSYNTNGITIVVNISWGVSDNSYKLMKVLKMISTYLWNLRYLKTVVVYWR